MCVEYAIVFYGHRYTCGQTRSPTFSPFLQHNHISPHGSLLPNKAWGAA
ncbi:hypothetical protein IEO21_10655 [Rhodonia placenta]|uniref:Uncharacterized protein n=1 Tax=Rhodonia placenta TaxID=104341 RepID=A0A8H7NS27_9APHY|nr:hypothetical protein IEO21_10655 [Postia placenta]